MLRNKLAAHVEYSSVLSRARRAAPCPSQQASKQGLKPWTAAQVFLYSILWLKRMVLMTAEKLRRRRNPWHHLLGASLNLSNVYVSCYTHMQMELYCSQLTQPHHVPRRAAQHRSSSAMNRLSSVLGCYAIPSFRSYPPPTHSQ